MQCKLPAAHLQDTLAWLRKDTTEAAYKLLVILMSHTICLLISPRGSQASERNGACMHTKT